MTATVTHLPVTQPQPSRSSAVLTAAILEAGGGPADVSSLLAGFSRASVLEREIRAVMATLEDASSSEEYLTSAGCAAVLAASRCTCDRNGPCRYPLCRAESS
jgi:hypothetical protein